MCFVHKTVFDCGHTKEDPIYKCYDDTKVVSPPLHGTSFIEDLVRSKCPKCANLASGENPPELTESHNSNGRRLFPAKSKRDTRRVASNMAKIGYYRRIAPAAKEPGDVLNLPLRNAEGKAASIDSGKSLLPAKRMLDVIDPRLRGDEGSVTNTASGHPANNPTCGIQNASTISTLSKPFNSKSDLSHASSSCTPNYCNRPRQERLFPSPDLDHIPPVPKKYPPLNLWSAPRPLYGFGPIQQQTNRENAEPNTSLSRQESCDGSCRYAPQGRPAFKAFKQNQETDPRDCRCINLKFSRSGPE